MSINLKQVVEYLLQEKYVFWYGRNLKFTSKFAEDLAAIQTASGAEPVKSWQDRYTQFIIEAEVPRRGENSRGDRWDLNKFSQPGVDGFRKAIMSGADYGRLVQSTRLYYRSSVSAKMAIGRYMSEGHWVTDYQALETAQDKGEQQQHEQQTTSDGSYTSWNIG